MSQSLLQWNCRGLRANYNELLLLLHDHEPLAVCLQETLLGASHSVTFSKYTSFHEPSIVSNAKLTGGVSILVRDGIPHSEIQLTTPLQAIALSVTLIGRAISLCSVYLPPTFRLDRRDLDDLLRQLPAPYIILGDLNGHSPTWGCRDFNVKGRLIEAFVTNNDISLLNSLAHTYIHPATGSKSSLDLALCHPSLFLDLSWKVHDDLCGSDHLPVFTEFIHSDPEQRVPRWKIHRADWNAFQTICRGEILPEDFADVEDPMGLFTTLVRDAAERSIPRSSTVPKKPNKVWFNEDCKTAIRNRQDALRNFYKSPSQRNLDVLRNSRAQARRVLKSAKRESWRKFVQGLKLDLRPSIKKTWRVIRNISGKTSSASIQHLKRGNDVISNKREIANSIAANFAHNSSCANYTPDFVKHQLKEESKRLRFGTKRAASMAYNVPFNSKELESALRSAKNTAAGPDEITYDILKHLPSCTKTLLLDICNTIWANETFPSCWREAVVIPILKPSKDPTLPNSYRPIALTSCVCKTMERMVNNRLVWYLESNHLISPLQSGFRKNRSTADHLVRLETFVRDAFLKKEHAVAIFFDLEKAYDTTWKYGIMKDLHTAGLVGRLPSFISNFLQDRTFRVRLGTTTSDRYEQEMGVPQGAILSVTLFILKINSIVESLVPGVEGSIFVDDFTIYCRSTHMRSIERRLQLCLNKLHTWSNTNGFKFSPSKTEMVHFSNLRGLHPDPEVTLGGKPIPVVKQHKFLGLIFDDKLNFRAHIKYLKKRCAQALNVLKVLASTDWGSNKDTLLSIYRALIRSKLDYGCFIYGAARPSYLKALEPIQNQALRLCLGAFRTSPIPSLHVEAGELPLSLRREKLGLQYALKLSSHHSNPAHLVVFQPDNVRLYASKPRVIPPFGLRMKDAIHELDVDVATIKRAPQPTFAPWVLLDLQINLDLAQHPKATTPPHVFQQAFGELRDSLPAYSFFYTDGSKEEEVVGAASVDDAHTVMCHLPDHTSIFSAEVKGIEMALEAIEAQDKVMICSDSLSALQALKHSPADNPILSAVVKHVHRLQSKGKTIAFCWIPGHVGILGNERADTAAKFSLGLPVANTGISYRDLRQKVNSHMQQLWQNQWNQEVFNKLHKVENSVRSKLRTLPVRREDCTLHRLRIGHTYLTHNFLLNKQPQRGCCHCQCALTVEHILVQCPVYSAIRHQHFTESNLQDLFKADKDHEILAFVRELGIYYML